jgi:hypothetical protein
MSDRPVHEETLTSGFLNHGLSMGTADGFRRSLKVHPCTRNRYRPAASAS